MILAILIRQSTLVVLRARYTLAYRSENDNLHIQNSEKATPRLHGMPSGCEIFHKESLKDLVFCKKILFTIKSKVDGNSTQTWMIYTQIWFSSTDFLKRISDLQEHFLYIFQIKILKTFLFWSTLDSSEGEISDIFPLPPCHLFHRCRALAIGTEENR